MPGEEVALALDPASSELWRDGSYVLDGEGRTLSSGELVEYWAALVERYPIVSIEDGMGEQDWDGWVAHTAALGDRVQIVGDDVFVTSAERLERGIEAGVANAVVGQAEPGRDPYRDARHHRDGDTCRLRGRRSRTARARPRTLSSPTSPSRPIAARSRRVPPRAPTRVAKYNRLLAIEGQLGPSAEYRGEAAFARSKGGGKALAGSGRGGHR